jgi:hypothetical protein
MSRTPVSELNARMSLDISPLEQAVPRATALLKRLSSVQAEAFASQSGGPDIRAMTERIRAASKSAGVLGTGSGTARFKAPEAEAAFVDPISQANEESLVRRATREKAFRDEQANAIAKIAADEKAYAQIAEQAEARRLENLRAREAYEQSIYDQKLRQAAADNAAATEEMSAIRNKANASAAAFIAEERAQQELADIRRQQAQVRATGEYSRANPFQQQVLAVQRLNQLLEERRRLLGRGDEVAIARATLAVNRQVQAVRNLRDELTVGAEGFIRLGNTSADSYKGFARFGLAAQQVGYQVQDFAVQVTSGTNAMVAFSQQASQVLGFFGGWKGAVAGAVLSAGILVYRLYDLKKGAEAAKKAQEDLNAVLKDWQDVRRGRVLLSDPSANVAFSEEDAKKANQLFGQTMSEIRAKEKELADARATQTETLIKPTPLGTNQAEIEQQQARIIAAQIAEKGLAEELIALRKKALVERVGAQQADLLLEQARVEAAREAVRVAQTGTDAYLAQQDAIRKIREAGEDAKRNDFERLANLRILQKDAEEFGQQETTEYQERQNLIDALGRSLKSQADAYKDQLDPLRAQKRELELINNLVNTQVDGTALLTQQEADLLRLRMQDERERTLRTPEALRIDTGASFAGMRNTDQSATTLISLQQQMLSIQQQNLAALKTLVFQGAN